MVSDGFHHFIIWFGEPDGLVNHPSFTSDPWQVFHSEAGGESSCKKSEGKSDESTAAADKIDPRKEADKGDTISKGGVEKKKKKFRKEVLSREIKFSYIKMMNTDEGFTVKKKLLAFIHDELNGQTSHRQAVPVNVTDETKKEEYLASGKDQENRTEKAKRIFKLVLADEHEYSEMTKRTYYCAVDSLKVSIEPKYKVNMKMKILQSSNDFSALVLRVSSKDFKDNFGVSHSKDFVVLKIYSVLDALINYYNVEQKFKDAGDEWFEQPTCDQYIRSHLEKCRMEVDSYQRIQEFNQDK
ncbi:unnamed protein product [Ambrosiozyma monospora]|uniref:Unnamed protein product n=1 Tax=Ambrosiozyma monospora TaxID=43982 RepID=A0ACB5T872_AMBMO|nr:unnamed protein product [Ambrosiozyma monospora]